VTPKLSVFQSKLSEAQDTMAQKEYDLFQEIRSTVLDSYSKMKEVSRRTAYVDFLSSLAHVAYNNNYVCPGISKGYDYQIQ